VPKQACQRSIHVTFHLPPIRTRLYDWCAVFDGYERGDLIAWGSTPEDAVIDLMEQQWQQWREEESLPV
jgi:hypothetical protein